MCVGICVWVAMGPWESTEPLELTLQVFVSCPIRCWEPDSGPFQEQYTPLTAEPSLHPPAISLFNAPYLLWPHHHSSPIQRGKEEEAWPGQYGAVGHSPFLVSILKQEVQNSITVLRTFSTICSQTRVRVEGQVIKGIHCSLSPWRNILQSCMKPESSRLWSVVHQQNNT